MKISIKDFTILLMLSYVFITAIIVTSKVIDVRTDKLVSNTDTTTIQHSNDMYEFDLPEEISEATVNDTLIAIKKDRKIYVLFNN